MNDPVTTIPAGVDKVKAQMMANEIADRMLLSYWATDASRAEFHDAHAHDRMAELAALFGCKLVPDDKPVQVAA